jgi:alkylation response protein AidB-like acyl-CoA dehydrogenase
MLLIDAHSEGITKSKLDKMGWWASDTAHLHFDDVRVPAKNLLGAENMGFFVIMNNFNMERFFLQPVAMVMRWFAMKKLWIGLNSDKLLVNA